MGAVIRVQSFFVDVRCTTRSTDIDTSSTIAVTTINGHVCYHLHKEAPIFGMYRSHHDYTLSGISRSFIKAARASGILWSSSHTMVLSTNPLYCISFPSPMCVSSLSHVSPSLLQSDLLVCRWPCDVIYRRPKEAYIFLNSQAASTYELFNLRLLYYIFEHSLL